MSETQIGSFELTGDTLRISDPCYDKDIWCNGTVKALPGTWVASIEKVDGGSWGIRVGRLFCRHIDYLDVLAPWEKLDIEVGVDSGQCGVFDELHYKDDLVAAGQPRFWDGQDGCKAVCEDEPWYSLCCDRTLSEAQAGVIPFGAVSSSGYGDGGYDAYAEIIDGVCVGIEVVFIDENAEDDEEDSDDWDEEDDEDVEDDGDFENDDLI